MESVAIGIWIGVGSRYEDKKLCGMSHLLEHMLFKGTQARTANDLKEAIEGVGGNFNGFTGEDATCYLVKLPSAYAELGLDILSDMVLNPKMDPAEIEKEKYVISEEIKMYLDQPDHQVFDILSAEMWPGHALGRPIAGYVDVIRSFRRSDITDFKTRHYQPANISVVIAGKADFGKCRKFAKKTFFMPTKKRTFTFERLGKKNKGNGRRILYKDTKQTHIALGFHTIKKMHRLRYSLGLLNIILGGNMSSRLFERLREKNPLCYDVSSSVKKYKETGAFIIHAGVDRKNLFEALQEIMCEVREIKNNLATNDELGRAKEYARGQLLLALEDTALRMLWLGDKIISEGKAPSHKEVIRHIEKVTLGDMREAAGLTFSGKNLNFATVGQVRSSIKNKLGRILNI